MPPTPSFTSPPEKSPEKSQDVLRLLEISQDIVSYLHRFLYTSVWFTVTLSEADKPPELFYKSGEVSAADSRNAIVERFLSAVLGSFDGANPVRKKHKIKERAVFTAAPPTKPRGAVLFQK